jgi:hypothetical protein
VICGNGLHDNPDLRVLDTLALSRLGSGDEKSDNPEADQPFEVWFNCSTAFLKQDIADRKKDGRPFAKYEGAAKHFAKIEKTMKTHKAATGGDRMKLHYLDDAPLVLDLAN